MILSPLLITWQGFTPHPLLEEQHSVPSCSLSPTHFSDVLSLGSVSVALTAINKKWNLRVSYQLNERFYPMSPQIHPMG